MRRLLLLLIGTVAACSQEPKAGHPAAFAIRVVDEATGRGVPLMELRTVNDITAITDNAGRIAWHEPGLAGRATWFHISGPGYEMQKDGFGFSGVRLTLAPGGSAEVKVKRTCIAERVGRLTGQGLYHHTAALGLTCPLPNIHPAGVTGQDSVQAVPYRGKLFWLWGDTNVAAYPLGNFRTTCATTPLELKPEQGLSFDYFMDSAKPGDLRRMMPLTGEGAVWLFGLLNVKDAAGTERLMAHYGRHPGLAPALEHGIAQFNDSSGVFESVAPLDKSERWRHPLGHAVRFAADGGDWFTFASPFPHTRVAATAKEVANPRSYEALRYDESSHQWQWQRALPPTRQADEARLLSAGTMQPEQARWQLTDAATGKPVRIHTGSVQWNDWRTRWVLIAVQSGDKGDPSPLGEVWYAESASPHGPWAKAVKVATHPRYSFYNPIHHSFLNADSGSVIYFEGTYTAEFSGNPAKTPRYDYNQLMYRLDLSHPALKPAQP